MKIGIAGSGMIVRTLLETLAHTVGEVEAEAICVREESRKKGEDLAAEFGIKTLYTNYHQLLCNANVDFVYIGIANQLHYEYAKKALECGKNVILEKPFTTNLKDALELVAVAKKKKLYLFEAITSIHTPMFKLMQENLDTIGEIKLVQGNFSQYSSRYDRYQLGEIFPAFNPTCYGGSLYDLNVYNIHLAVAILGQARKVEHTYNVGWNNIDTSGVLVLSYEHNKAVLLSAKDSSSPCYFQVQGTKGYMRIIGAINSCPSLEIVRGEEKITYEDSKADIRMIHEILEFKSIWESNDFGKSTKLLDQSIMVMDVLERSKLYGK